jgi:hypothetical protein
VPRHRLSLERQSGWEIELDLRALKITLGMDVLRCKSPAMVRKEIWAHFLVYNLIRTVMARAALDLGAAPRMLSFTGALQAVRAFAEQLLHADGARRRSCTSGC